MQHDGSAARVMNDFLDRQKECSKNGQYRKVEYTYFAHHCDSEFLVLTLAEQNGVNINVSFSPKLNCPNSLKCHYHCYTVFVKRNAHLILNFCVVC